MSKNITLELNKSTAKHSRAEYLKQWRYNNPDKTRQYKRNYYEKHSEQERERQRKYYHSDRHPKTRIYGEVIKNTHVTFSACKKTLFITKYANEEFKQKIRDWELKLHTAYRIIKSDLNQFCYQYTVKTIEKNKTLTKKEILEIKQQFPNLTNNLEVLL